MSNHHENLTDAEIIERFKKGDKNILNVLITRYANKAYQIAYGVLGDKEDAEEVAQDAFVRIYKALPKFRGDSEFSTWMYRIVVNLARNKYRWNKSRGAQKNISFQSTATGDDSSPSLEMKLPDEGLTPEQKAELSEFENALYREMQNLPDLYKEALILRNIEEMSYEEIARVLNCKLGTIKSRIARARDELRKRLEL